MSRTIHTLHDLAISLECTHSGLAEALRAILRYKGATQRKGQPSEEADMTWVFCVEDVLPEVPSGTRQIGEQEHEIEVFQNGDDYYLRHPEIVVQIDAEAQHVEGHARPSLTQASQEQQPALFYIAILSLVVLLQHRGAVVLHAAALARAQRGLLLVGHSGSGKSTTTFSLVRQGWGYLSDDTVLLRHRDDRIEALSFRKDFCIAPEAAVFFPELGESPWPNSLSNAAKWSVDVQALYDAPALKRCDPQRMLFPSVEPEGSSHVKPMSDKEAFLRLVYQTPIWVARGSRESVLYTEMLRRLLSQTVSYRLFLGEDALDAPEKLDELVSSVMVA